MLQTDQKSENSTAYRNVYSDVFPPYPHVRTEGHLLTLPAASLGNTVALYKNHQTESSGSMNLPMPPPPTNTHTNQSGTRLDEEDGLIFNMD